jgi:protein O-GlcNAc transferase
MKNVVAYSLWGDAPMYWIGAVRNIEQVKNYFPGWICRFYIDNSCDEELIKTIKGDNVEVILVDSKDSFHGMFWRFWASEEEETDVFLSRDCDSRFSDREVAAIKEWLSSNNDFHIIRDHPYHSVPILGGMWGCRNGLMREIGLSKLIEQWGKYERKGIDQEFLAKLVYPLVKDKALEHCDFNLNFGGKLTPFPTKRENFEFVGDVFDENDIRHPDYWILIKNAIE